jgi:hypothetical protein
MKQLSVPSDRQQSSRLFDKAKRYPSISEIENWKSAKVMVAHFGDRALARSQERAKGCQSRADIDGWIRWMRIAEAILELHIARPNVLAPVGDAHY